MKYKKTFFFAWWKLQFSSYFSLNFHAKRKKLFALLLLPFVPCPGVRSPRPCHDAQRNRTSTHRCVCVSVLTAGKFYSSSTPVQPIPPQQAKPRTRTQRVLPRSSCWNSRTWLCVSNWKGKRSWTSGEISKRNWNWNKSVLSGLVFGFRTLFGFLQKWWKGCSPRQS